MAIGDFMGSGFDFAQPGAFPTTATGGVPYSMWGSPTGALAPDVAATYMGSPEAFWQTSRLAQMGDRAALPQFARQASMGFAPAYGSYLMTGDTAPFTSYGGAPSATGWHDVLAASAASGNTEAIAGLNPQQATIQGYLQGENARRNTMAILAAQRGGMAGSIGGQAYQRAMGNLYNLYTARAGAAGQAPAGFLSWLDAQRNAQLV